MTDRADEIAREYVEDPDGNGAELVSALVPILRAYGDECRNAALEEAAEAADMVDTVAGEAIRDPEQVL